MAGFLGLLRRERHERTGFELYNTAVAAARDPFLYVTAGVPDTLDGRFDLVGLHAFLLIHRISRAPDPGPKVAQAVFDAMFSDMDVNLREMGVGDLSVGKRVKHMWDAFHGRSVVYTEAVDAGDGAALEAALGRNLWRGGTPPEGATAMLARMVRAQIAALAAQDDDRLFRGEVRFLPAMEACR